MKIKKIFTIFLLTLALIPSFSVFASTEDYITSIESKYKTWTNKAGNTFFDSPVVMQNYESLYSSMGPFYKMSYIYQTQRELYSEYISIDLTSAIDQMFDTTKLIQYDRDYYLDVLYYTENIAFTNLNEDSLTGTKMYSYITNDVNYLRNNREAFDKDLSLLKTNFKTYNYNNLTKYVHLGRQQCKVVDEENKIYKCRITYLFDPDNFHKSADKPNQEVAIPQLVFDLPYSTQNPSSIYLYKIGLNQDLRGTDEMIPKDEELITYYHSNDLPEKTLLDYIKDIFRSLLELPQKLMSFLKDLFVPDSDYFTLKFNVLKKLLEEKLGFLSYPFVLLEKIANYVYDISESTTAILKIPKIDFMGHTLFNEVSFDLMTFVNSSTATQNFYSIYKTFASALIVFWLVNLAIKKEKEIVSGGGN